MMFLPLGLDIKIFRIPWATLVLIAINLVISFQSFKDVESVNSFSLHSEKRIDVIYNQFKMLALICEKEPILSTAGCEGVKIKSRLRPSSVLQAVTDFPDEFSKASPTDRIKDAKLLRDMLLSDQIITRHQALLGATQAYQDWKSASQAYDQEMKAELRRSGLLSRSTWNLVSLIKAQFVHAGYGHLFGNLLFFILLSVFVELRVGTPLAFFFYVLTGIAGLGGQLLMLESSTMPLMGASASISGIAGAFTVFFWRKNIRVFASALFYNRVILMPVHFFFPILVVSSDLVGVLNPFQSNVAHYAHLGGFLFGVLFAWALVKLDNLPKEFTFMSEFLEYGRIQKSAPSERFAKWAKLLEMNPENYLIHQQMLSEFKGAQAWTDLSVEKKSYIQKRLINVISTEKKNEPHLFWILNHLQLSWPLKEIFKSTSRSDLRNLFLKAHKQNEPAAGALLKALFLKFPQLNRDPEWATYENFYLKSEIHQKGPQHVSA